MLSRKGIKEYFKISIATVNRWIGEGRIPSTLENLKTGLWDEKVIEKVKYKPRVILDIELIRELAKTKTIPEIARELGVTNGTIEWRCKKNGIKAKLGVTGRPKKPNKISKKEQQLNIFNQMLNRSVKS